MSASGRQWDSPFGNKLKSDKVESIGLQQQAPRLPKPVGITEQAWPEGTVPVVSVFSWVYNHAEFIRESIESILTQETAFPVEIIIHDDASTDGTTEIIREYEAKHPQLFRNVIQTENQWSQGKSVMDPMFTVPRGSFIALAHGDDHWTSPHKLQKQVDFLEKDRDITICAHAVDIVDDTGSVKQKYPFTELSGTVSLKDYLRSPYNPFHTASVVFRAGALQDIDFWWNDLGMGDWPLFMCLLDRGSGYFINENMAVWRHHHGGVWALQPRLNSITKSLEAIPVMRSHLGNHYTAEFDKLEQFWRYREVMEHVAADNFPIAKDKLVEAVGKGFFPDKGQLGVLLRVFLLGTFPKLHRLYRRSRSRLAPASA
jgi:glycosyltransferase involved in cell wall biosynthesis